MRPNGQSTGFQSFDTTEDGLKAVDNNLKSYGEKRGIDTLAGVISTWSPESDGNNTKKLIEDASRVTGLKPDQKIDLSNPAVRTVVAAAIIRQEGSQSYLTGIGNGKRPIGEAPPKSPVAGGLGAAAAPKPAPAEKKSSFWTDPNNPLAGSIDIGSAFGKPIAAVGEMVGKDVGATADLFKAIAEMSPETQSVLMKNFMKYPDMAIEANKVFTEKGIEGLKWWVSQMNPAKNTEDHMQRTSSKNLNQYFR
jgi:hypothetical protein